VNVPLVPLPADVSDMVRAGPRRREPVCAPPRAPTPVDVDVVSRSLKHVRGQAPGGRRFTSRAKIPPSLSARKNSKWKEPLGGRRRARGARPRLLEVRRDLPEGSSRRCGVLVHRFHDPWLKACEVKKTRFPSRFPRPSKEKIFPWMNSSTM